MVNTPHEDTMDLNEPTPVAGLLLTCPACPTQHVMVDTQQPAVYVCHACGFAGGVLFIPVTHPMGPPAPAATRRN